MAKPRVIYWFRTDLRLHDSPALKAALDLSPEVLYPVWCWDPHYVYRARVGPNRWQYLLDCQNDLSSSITKINPRSRLLVIREAPQTLLPKLFRAWRISHLVFEKDTDAYGRDRDTQLIRLAKEAGVEVVVRVGRTLYDPDRLVEENGGKPTMSIAQAGAKIGDIPRPIPPPTSLPDPGDTTLEFEQQKPEAEPDWNAPQRDRKDASYAQLAGPGGDFSVPTIAELGIKQPTTRHRGGESAALAALDAIIADEKYTATFEKPNTAPTAFAPPATTVLSPHLHFGSLSCRAFYWAVQDVVDRYGARASKPPTSLTGQLLFRDMYFGAQASLGYRFAQTVGNGHCRFVPWHLPSVLDPATGLVTGDYEVDSPLAATWFRRWKFGRTGFPWIDALMRQLRHEGWIHHLGRHAVASFLTRGGCYIDWMRGADVFEEWLLDHEVACNIGNWQWLSCTAFFAQFYRVYSPVAFGARWDKDGAFVRRYVPELRRFPAKYVYEPWKCPIKDQKAAGCVIRDYDEREHHDDELLGPIADGRAPPTTYPKPLFDFATRRAICLAGMKKAYEVGLYGNDARVLDGTWRASFPDDAEGPTEGNNALEAHLAVNNEDQPKLARRAPNGAGGRDGPNGAGGRAGPSGAGRDGPSGAGHDGSSAEGRDVRDRKRIKGVGRTSHANGGGRGQGLKEDDEEEDDDDDDDEAIEEDEGGAADTGIGARGGIPTEETSTGETRKRKRDAAATTTAAAAAAAATTAATAASTARPSRYPRRGGGGGGGASGGGGGGGGDGDGSSKPEMDTGKTSGGGKKQGTLDAFAGLAPPPRRARRSR